MAAQEPMNEKPGEAQSAQDLRQGNHEVVNGSCHTQLNGGCVAQHKQPQYGEQEQHTAADTEEG